jgi:hypothetical protein
MAKIGRFSTFQTCRLALPTCNLYPVLFSARQGLLTVWRGRNAMTQMAILPVVLGAATAIQKLNESLYIHPRYFSQAAMCSA